MLEKCISTLRRVDFIVLSLILWSTTVEAQGVGPKITLRYAGEIEGAEATATLLFEDIRTIVNPPGFQAASPFGWVRQYPLTGWIYVEGKIITPTASYGFGSDVVGTSDFGYGDAFRLDAFERFRIRLDFPSDQDFVFLDRFALVPNPIADGTPSYLFVLESTTDPGTDGGGGTPQPKPPSPAPNSTTQQLAGLLDQWATLIENRLKKLDGELEAGERKSKVAKGYQKTLAAIEKGETRLGTGTLPSVFTALGRLYKANEKTTVEELTDGFEDALSITVAHSLGVIEHVEAIITFRKQNSMKVSTKVERKLARAKADLRSLRSAAVSTVTFTGLGKLQRKLDKLSVLLNR